MRHAERESSPLVPRLRVRTSLRRGDARRERVAASPTNFFRELPLTTRYAGFQPCPTGEAQGGVCYSSRTTEADLPGLPNLAVHPAAMVTFAVVFVFHAEWELVQRRGRRLVTVKLVPLTAGPLCRSRDARTPTPNEARL